MESNTTKCTQIVIPKTLHWKYSGSKDKIWIGELRDSSNIRFELHELNNNKYIMKSNLNGIRKLVIRDLDNAKMMAQEHFNTYALGLIEEEN